MRVFTDWSVDKRPSIERGVNKVKPGEQYNRTPVGPFYTEEQRKRLRETIPHGIYPKISSRNHRNVKGSYYVPPVKIAEDRIHPYDLDSFAKRIIASVAGQRELMTRRRVWEKSLLDAWFHLYGDDWREWQLIIPWLSRGQVAQRAAVLDCEPAWNWMAKQRFLGESAFAWSLEDLNYLIDRYPDRQINEREQGIFVSDRPFSEIQRVAHALGLPTREELSTLADYARELVVG